MHAESLSPLGGGGRCWTVIDAGSDRFARLFARESQVSTRKVVPQVHLAGNDRERLLAERNQRQFSTFIENGQAAHNLSQPVST
jgi:hypothetical protein